MATDNNNKVLNVPNLRFPEFSGEWKLHATTDYFEFKNGLNPEAKRFGLGTKFISVMDILNNRYITYDKVIASVLPKDDDLKEFGVNYGDILFQRSSETLEDVGRANVYLDDKTALFGGFVIRGKKIGNYNPLFFRYLLSSPNARKSIIVKGAGAQHFNISQDGLSKVLLNVPSIQEQEKISRFINYIDERIDTQSKIIEKLESLIKGLCQKLTQQGDSNTTLNECLECYSSTLQENSVFHAGDFPVYGATGVCGYTDSPEANGDSILIIKDGASVGVTYYASGKYSAIGTLNRLVAKNGYSLTYLYYCLKVFNFAQYRTGLAIPHIYFRDYGKAHIWCPPIEEQNQIANTLEKVEQKIVTEKSLLEQLYSQKRFLLQTMFI